MPILFHIPINLWKS